MAELFQAPASCKWSMGALLRAAWVGEAVKEKLCLQKNRFFAESSGTGTTISAVNTNTGNGSTPTASQTHSTGWKEHNQEIWQIRGQTCSTGASKTQKLIVSDMTADPFAFLYWVKGSALPKTGTCRAQVLLYKTAGGIVTYTVKCPTAATFTWKQMKLNFTAPVDYSNVVIKFMFKKTGGSVWFDGVNLNR